MGLLVDGVWHDKWYDTDKHDGRFVRSESQFRNWVTADGSSGFPAEKGRYHLYVSLACPWAHRALVLRKLKGLEDMIDVSVVHPLMLENGWELKTGVAGATGDPLFGFDRLYQLYLKADPHYSGRVTVPVLWDKHEETIVSNESADIIRMFNSAFDELGAREGDFYPPRLQAQINDINDAVYDNVNNGVYKAGFATTQEAYEEAVHALFDELDSLDTLLGTQRYLVGNEMTEADWRLFTTLVRFDAVYVGHFKCNLRRIADYPNLSGYLRDLYQTPGVAETVNFKHIKLHYYGSHHMINPTGIVPVGPAMDLDAPHGREHLGGQHE